MVVVEGNGGREGAIRAWLALREEMMRATVALEVEAGRLQDELDQAREPYQEKMAALEEKIKAATLELERPANVGGVQVTYRRGYTRTTWDSRALKGYAAAHPEIDDFKSEKYIKPHVGFKPGPWAPPAETTWPPIMPDVPVDDEG
jgi:hypothetical protein